MQIGLINRAQYNIRVYKQLQNSNRVASASGTKSLSLIAVEIVRLRSNYFTPFTFVMKILSDILHLIDTFSVRFNIVTFFLLFTIRHVGQQWVTFITRLAVDQSFPVFLTFTVAGHWWFFFLVLVNSPLIQLVVVFVTVLLAFLLTLLGLL